MVLFYEILCDENFDEEDFDYDEVDVLDFKEKYEVQFEQGYDIFVVIDGFFEVIEEQKFKFVKFLLKKFNMVGKISEDVIFMFFGDYGKLLWYVGGLYFLFCFFG